MLNEENFSIENQANLELLSKTITKMKNKKMTKTFIENLEQESDSIPQAQSSQDITHQVALDQQLMELM